MRLGWLRRAIALASASKPGAEGGVLAELHGQDFQRDRAIQGLLHGAIDRAHAAGGDEALDFISREKRREIGGVRSYEAGIFVGVAHGNGEVDRGRFASAG